MWVLGTDPRSSVSVVSILNCCAVFLHPQRTSLENLVRAMFIGAVWVIRTKTVLTFTPGVLQLVVTDKICLNLKRFKEKTDLKGRVYRVLWGPGLSSDYWRKTARLSNLDLEEEEFTERGWGV